MKISKPNLLLRSSIFWDITPYSHLKSSDVLEEYVASVFRAKKEAKQETSVKAGGKLCLGSYH
jgi:hypothetical protein